MELEHDAGNNDSSSLEDDFDDDDNELQPRQVEACSMDDGCESCQ